MTRKNYIDAGNRTRLKKYDSYEVRPDSKRKHLIGGAQNLLPKRANNIATSSDVRSIKASYKNQSTTLTANTKPQRNLKTISKNFNPNTRKVTNIPAQNHTKNLSIAEEAVTYSFPDKTGSPVDSVYYMLGSENVQRGRQSRGWSQKLFYAFGALIFVATTILSTYAFYLNKQANDGLQVLAAETQNVDAQGVPQGTGSEPAEDKPDDTAFFNYNVDPEKPRYLRIPDLSLYSRIKELGLTTDGSIDAPWNVHDTGWYNGSIKPGSKNGVSLIMGHVSGRYSPGIFESLHRLEEGQIVEVELGNGDVKTYKVDKVEEYPVDSIDMRKILYEVEEKTHSLRLMTCAGVFDSQNQEYKSRTVVYTTQVK